MVIEWLYLWLSGGGGASYKGVCTQHLHTNNTLCVPHYDNHTCTHVRTPLALTIPSPTSLGAVVAHPSVTTGGATVDIKLGRSSVTCNDISPIPFTREYGTPGRNQACMYLAGCKKNVVSKTSHTPMSSYRFKPHHFHNM
jgi:hypothetical protein